MHARTVALLSAGVLFAGCANDVDEDDARTGWRSTSSALLTTQSKLTTEVDASGVVDLTAACPDGGSVTYTGSFAGFSDFGLGVELDGCKAFGVTTDGELTYRASVYTHVDDDGSETRVELSYTGHVSWSGKVEGDCEIDATMRVETSTGNGMASATTEASGTVCGYSGDVFVQASAG